MAKLNNISNSTALDFGFSFEEFSTGMNGVYGSVDSMFSTMFNSGIPVYGQNPDGSYYANWSDGTELWAKGSMGTSSATIQEFSLSKDDVEFFFIGSGKVSVNTNTGEISVSTIKVSEIYVGDGSNTGYGQAYQGSLTIDPDTLSLNGTIKTAYLIAGNTPEEPGDAYCIRLTGSVTMTNDEFSGGSVTGIAWGSMTMGNDNPQFTWTSEITGLKIDAVALMNAVQTGGFDALPSLIYGGNDTLVGTAGDDLLAAFAGNDKIDGGAGDDHIYGGAGNDTIVGGAGNDTIFGDVSAPDASEEPVAGNDKITDQEGDNTVYAGNGNNGITLGAGNDYVVVGDGTDKIALGEGGATATLSVAPTLASIGDAEFPGQLFHNVAFAGDGKKSVTAGAGDDYIAAGNGNNALSAGNGDNVIRTGDGNNKITTGSGDDVVIAGNGNNNITVGDGANQVETGNGNNKVTSGTGDDDIQAGSGNDTITAGNGNNSIDAGAGNNKITVGEGNDTVEAGSGNDTVKLGLGADTANLGAGKNTIDLGKDNATDTVEFDADFFAAVKAGLAASNTVSNFSAGDELWFDLAGLELTAGDIAVGSTAEIAGAVIGLDVSTGKLYYDADGAGTESAATLIGSIKGAGIKESFSIQDDGTVHFAL